MKFWFDKILVHSWLPKGVSGDWSVRRTIVEGDLDVWLAGGGDPYSNLLIPNYVYTGLYHGEDRVMIDDPTSIMEILGFVNQAKGTILVTGLGVGMSAVWLSRQAAVTAVDVMENSEDVIKLVGPYLPSPKITIIHADAFEYVPTKQYDAVWHACFSDKPTIGQVENLTTRFKIKNQHFWEPNKLTQPDRYVDY